MKNTWLLLSFFTGVIIMMFVMAETGTSLKTAATPHGILDLEFAYNTTKEMLLSRHGIGSHTIQLTKTALQESILTSILFFCSSMLLFYFLPVKELHKILKAPLPWQVTSLR